MVGEGGKGMSACLLHCICMCVCVRAHVRNHSCGGGDPAAAVINFHGPRPAVVVAAAASTHSSLGREVLFPAVCPPERFGHSDRSGGGGLSRAVHGSRPAVDQPPPFPRSLPSPPHPLPLEEPAQGVGRRQWNLGWAKQSGPAGCSASGPDPTRRRGDLAVKGPARPAGRRRGAARLDLGRRRCAAVAPLLRAGRRRSAGAGGQSSPSTAAKSSRCGPSGMRRPRLAGSHTA